MPIKASANFLQKRYTFHQKGYAMLSLQCPLLDSYHDEFDVLLTSFDDASFLESFLAIRTHTEKHFAHEEALMKQYNFQGLSEHREEHQKILAELAYFYEMAENGRKVFAKNYIHNGIKERFDLHIRNIDSQLALFLNMQGIG